MRLIPGVLALLLLSSTFLFAQPAPRLLVELDDTAAQAARHYDQLPSKLMAVAGQDAELVPIFYEPNDAAHRASWYKHGLNRWFRVVSKVSAETLYSQLTGGDGILSVEMDELHHSFNLPDDYSIHNMWGLDIMECPEAWDLYQGDTEILITTIDTGCKITHEDLWENMYINPIEDLNGNGIWDESDNNGIDDDNNGFIDDLTGWDFVSVDPFGTPAEGEDYGPRDNMVFPDIHGHGTHVQGTAAATTDNGIGVASASWNVVSFPSRAGFAWLDGSTLQGSGMGSDFMAAIQYAVDNGTRVISISFGGTGFSQAYQDAVSYARDNNVILFASAGNSGNSVMNYPAAYEGAIAVVASTPTDSKAGFSTYGEWCGITAPGTGIWSTMVGENYRPEDYVAWQGTSMASPNAASVAAYVISYMPQLTDDQVEAVMHASTDDLDVRNPSYAGLLGSGRVNARRALEYAPSATVPPMEYVSADVDRQTGLVTLSWYSDPGERDDFVGYNVYRDGEVLFEETLDEEMNDQLPEPGDYLYTVRGVYGSIETLPMTESVNFSGLFGLPIVDNYEFPEDTPWEFSNPDNARHFTSLVYDGERAVGVSSPTTRTEGIQRYFADSEGVQVETWFQATGYPNSGGEAAAIHLFNGDDRIKVFVGNDADLWVKDFGEGDAFPLNSIVDIDYDHWYHISVRYLDGLLDILLLDENKRMVLHQTLTVTDLPIDGILLGSVNLDNGWSFFDVTTVKLYPTELEYFTPVEPNSGPYPIVIVGGLPRPLTMFEIAVLDGDLVVGAIAPDHDVYPLVLNAYEDLGNGQGFTEGNNMTFEIRNIDENNGETLEIGDIQEGDGSFGSGDYTRITLFSPSDVGDETPAGLPKEFHVDRAYPNPFNPSFTVNVAMPSAGQVKMAMYNVLGQRVLTQAHTLTPGNHILSVNTHDPGRSLATGVYILQVRNADNQFVQKVVLVR